MQVYNTEIVWGFKIYSEEKTESISLPKIIGESSD